MPANVREVGLSEELLAEAQPFKGEPLARKLLGDLAYRSRRLKGSLAECGILLVTERQSSEGLGNRGRSPSQASSGSFASERPWPPASQGWSPGSRRR